MSGSDAKGFIFLDVPRHKAGLAAKWDKSITAFFEGEENPSRLLF